MYVNKCIKCGAEFETKNPKRVICPNCLYADKNSSSPAESAAAPSQDNSSQPLQSYSSYSTEDRPQRQYDNRNNNYSRPRNDSRGGYQQRRPYDNNRNQSGGYQQRRPYDNNRSQGGQNYNRPYNRDNQGGGYNRAPQQRRPYNNQGGGYNRGPQNRRPGGFQQRKPQRPLLISKEQLEQIEIFYKTMLPLPNPDAHEVIGEKLGIEPRKVFFGINLVRQKLMLPKLPFPKRKLAVSPDQMLAVKSLYEPLLPLPPIGCHKIIAAQLRIDEWRVHVAIKLIRAQLGLDRWNEERPDKPADYMVPKHPQGVKKGAKAETKEDTLTTTPEEEEEKPKKKTTRKTAVKKAETEEKVEEEAEAAEKPKRGRKPKKKDDE